ncbi:arsenite efflux transporter metallochaperone ArsD [Paenibacillus sp. FSL K6-2524]|uniref:arsenite efflux transporter metallochaperone ArsD n=1 Tax=Paenibacillus sp. FSL K6-2524 TaxID=2954516 RepID=UPI0030F883A6
MSQLKIEIYDPALCCSTGVCGPSVDPELIRIAADVDALHKQGVSIQRFNLSQDVQAFTINNVVLTYLQQNGPDAFPIVLIDDELKAEKRYPTREELSAWTGITLSQPSVGMKAVKIIKVNSVDQDCCEPGSGCC